MERIKFEENSREKLEERELQPSAGAWNTLEAMLEEEQPSKKGGGFTWLAIAASFIGIVIIASIYFNQNEKNNSLVIEDLTPEILKEDQTKSPFKTVEEINKENQTIAETVNEKPTTENEIDNDVIKTLKEKEQRVTSVTTKNGADKNVLNTTKNNSNTAIKTQQVKNNALIKFNNGTVKNIGQISAVPNEKPKEENKDDAVIISEKTNPSINTVVAQIKEIQNKKGVVTETEINALLATAQLELKLQRQLDVSQGKVDAMALLNDVEMDVERSFRDRVFLALGDGIEYLKTATVNHEQ